MDTSKIFTLRFLSAVLVAAFVAGAAVFTPVDDAFAIPDEEMRTVFAIGDIADYGTHVSINAFIVFGDQLIPADTWQVPTRLGGAVGLAVDQVNELLFMSFEHATASDDDDFDGDEEYWDSVATGGKYVSDTIDVFSARDGSYITQIYLPGTSNLAGMVVHQDRGHLYVVDRGDKDIFVFDTNNNFSLVEHWVLPIGGLLDGAWGIDLIDDVLYVTNPGPLFGDHVHWFDIDTRALLGTYSWPEVSTGIVVMQDQVTPANGPLIFTTQYDGFLGAYDEVQMYAQGSGTYDSWSVGNNTAGISANPGLNLLYVSHAGFLGASPKIKVIDISTMAVVNTYNLQGGNSPTDVVASSIPFGGTVSKTLTSHPTGNIPMGQQATFEIEITNKGNYPLVMIPLNDIFDPSHFTFVSASVTPDNVSSGSITWNDLTTTLGSLAPTNSFYINVVLEAVGTCTTDLEGSNLAQVQQALDSMGNQMWAAGVADYVIQCNCITNADCDDGLWCNGLEYCDTNGDCQSDVSPCPDDGLFCNGLEDCNEVLNQCTNTGPPCPDDGVFCNGPETCNEANDTCSSGGDPCPDDGLWCNGAETCNEAFDRCDANPPCPDDGIFCNGDETCNEVNHTCDHAGDPCADDGLWCNGEESCNEFQDKCDIENVPCPDDGVFCNGDETCNEAGQTCDHSGDPCVDDGVWCNGTESCDETAQECIHSGNPCVDDGIFCNGVEACNENGQICESSGNPCEDDGLFCNGVESCSENDGECVSTGDPCLANETCSETEDKCLHDPGDGDDDDTDDGGDEEGLWPEGSVSGGSDSDCCGC